MNDVIGLPETIEWIGKHRNSNIFTVSTFIGLILFN